MLFCCSNVVSAAENSDATISCSTQVVSKNVIITGQVQNATEIHNVTLRVGELDNIIYLCQTQSSEDGSFTFDFPLPDDIVAGIYSYRVNTDANTDVFVSSFEYVGEDDSTTSEETAVLTCSVRVVDNDITISGQIEGATKEHNVSLRVGELDNVLHLAQTKSDTTGSFIFNFPFSEEVPAGTYTYVVNTDANTGVFTGTFEYGGFPSETIKLFNSEFIIDIGSNYIPNISGTASCAHNKNLQISVLSADESDVIANDTVMFEDGKYELTFSNTEEILNQRQSHINITCNDGNKQLAKIDATLNYSKLLIGFSGRLEMSNGVWAYVQLQSVDSDFLDKKAVVRSSQDVSFALPNLMVNSTYRIKVWGYYNEPIIEEDDIKTSCSIYGSSNKIVLVIAKGEAIPNIENQVFTLSYDPDLLTPIKYFGLTPKEELTIGVHNNIEILSIENGNINFKMIDIPPYTDRKWSGVLNVFKFKFKQTTQPVSSLVTITHEEVE